MKRVPVESSNIAAVAHDPATNVLEIEFKNGTVYQYHGVDADKHSALMKADSVGGFLNAHIKGAHKFSKA